MKIILAVLVAGITVFFYACNMNESILEDEITEYIKKTYNAEDVKVETFEVPREKIRLQGQPEEVAKDIYLVKFSFKSDRSETGAEHQHYEGIAGFYREHVYPLDEDAYHFFHFNKDEQPFIVDKDSLRLFVNRTLQEPPMVTLVNNGN